jgi:uncharacterized membrane protein (GlpM family)
MAFYYVPKSEITAMALTVAICKNNMLPYFSKIIYCYYFAYNMLDLFKIQHNK